MPFVDRQQAEGGQGGGGGEGEEGEAEVALEMEGLALAALFNLCRVNARRQEKARDLLTN